MKKSRPKIFQIHEGLWFVARTRREAFNAIGAYYDKSNYDFKEVRGLSDKELDENEYWVDEEGGDTVTFRERLNQIIANKLTVPDHFAESIDG